MNFFKVIVLCCLVSSSVHARNFYFSMEGSDTNSGIKPSKAWKSMSKLNSLKLNAGDSVLFRRGDVFTGEISVKQSGKDGKPIVFSAYGKGSFPVLTGAIPLENSVLNLAKQHVFSINKKVLKLYVNDKKQTLARYPNSGYLTMGNGIDSIGFETTLTEPNGYWKGASVNLRTIDWVFEHREIASFENKKLKFTENSIYKIIKGYGYFLENKPELIDSQGEWYSSDNTVQILSNHSLNEQKVEGVIFKNAVTLKPGVKNIVIKSLMFDKYAESGIWAQHQCGNLDIQSNIIQNMGLMGIWLDTLVSNVSVKSNLIEDIAGRGISGIRNKNCSIQHNTIRRIGLWPGEGVSGVNGMEGIVIENQEVNQSLSTACNNRIAFNMVDSTGYAGIRMDGQNSTCEFNIVKNTSLKLNDSGAIYCFGKVKKRTNNNSINNNLIINAVGNVEATPSNDMATNGIYIDNNSTQISVFKNTIINASSIGIFVNDAAPNNLIKDNTIFNCINGIGFAEWANKDSLYGNFIEKNCVVCVEKTQRPIVILTYFGPNINVGQFINNKYINAHDDFVINYKTDPEIGLRRDELFRLSNWQKFKNQEFGSESLQYKDASIIYNDSFEKRDILLPHGDFKNIAGVKLAPVVKLMPCESIIIIPIK